MTGALARAGHGPAASLRRALAAEAGKLPGSLAGLVLVLAPALLGLLCFLAASTAGAPPSWTQLIAQLALPLWGVFLLPMAITALATLLAQIEHAEGAWAHLMSLPAARWPVIAAKILAVLVGVVVMTVLVVVFCLVGGVAGGAIAGGLPTGGVPTARLAERAAEIGASVVLLSVIQTWTSLRFSSFVVSLGVGGAGVLIALAVGTTGTARADWFPWVYPIATITRDPALPLLAFSLVGGTIAAILATIDLASRPIPR